MAFNDAITDLGTGRIDYAVVGGASGIFRPQTSIAFQRLHMMSPDVRSHHYSLRICCVPTPYSAFVCCLQILECYLDVSF